MSGNGFKKQAKASCYFLLSSCKKIEAEIFLQIGNHPFSLRLFKNIKAPVDSFLLLLVGSVLNVRLQKYLSRASILKEALPAGGFPLGQRARGGRWKFASIMMVSLTFITPPYLKG